MGASNVALLLTRWTRYLNDVPFRVAAQMCLTALDEADQPQYFGGWAMLANAAGATYRKECGERKGCRGCDGCRAARRTVTRALRELTDVQFIRLHTAPSPGTQAVFDLLVRNDPSLTAEPIKRRGMPIGRPYEARAHEKRATPSVQQTHDTWRHATLDVQRRATRDTLRHAEEDRGTTEEYVEEENSPQSQPHLGVGGSPALGRVGEAPSAFAPAQPTPGASRRVRRCPHGMALAVDGTGCVTCATTRIGGRA